VSERGISSLVLKALTSIRMKFNVCNEAQLGSHMYAYMYVYMLFHLNSAVLVVEV
jgi:hypothetical protein